MVEIVFYYLKKNINLFLYSYLYKLRLINVIFLRMEIIISVRGYYLYF